MGNTNVHSIGSTDVDDRCIVSSARDVAPSEGTSEREVAPSEGILTVEVVPSEVTPTGEFVTAVSPGAGVGHGNTTQVVPQSQKPKVALKTRPLGQSCRESG